MSFAAPIMLVFLVLVPVAAFAYLWIERRREEKAAQWARPDLVPNLVRRPSARLRHIPAILFLIGLTFLLLGIARPEAKLTTDKEGSTIVLAVDQSGSMAAKDIKPSRLLAARAAILGFLEKLPSKYRVALEVFTEHPYVTVPPTYDRVKVAEALPLKPLQQGTDIGDAVQTAATVAAKTVGVGKPGVSHPPATVVLISDGAQTVRGLEPRTAALAAKKLGVPVAAVLVGTPKGVVTQKLKVNGYPETKTITVPNDPIDLQTIAKASGGRFYSATSAQQLLQIYKDLGSHQAHTKTKHEVTAAAVGIALAFIVAGVILSGIWFRRFA